MSHGRAPRPIRPTAGRAALSATAVATMLVLSPWVTSPASADDGSAATGQTQTSTPTDTADPTPASGPTESPTPTQDPAPTEAPAPTQDPAPTDAPTPTQDPAPTSAPAPTVDPSATGTPTPSSPAAPQLQTSPQSAAPQRAAAPLPGVGQVVAPQFGIGKGFADVTVEPEAGTFPADQPVDLTGLTVQVTDSQGTLEGSCQLVPEGAGSTYGCTAPQNPFGMPQGVPLTASIDPSDPALPAGFLAPTPVGFTIGSASDSCVPVEGPISGTQCTASVTLELPGTWRPVGLAVTNAVTGAPVAGATYELQQGGATLGSATTDANGKLVFPGLHQGGSYEVVPTAVPPGYDAGAAQELDVPVVASADQAGQEYDGTATLAPAAPVLRDDTATLTEDTSTEVDVLANDRDAGDLTITGVTSARHGTVSVKAGELSYVPQGGFVGTDTFDYTAQNALGGVASAVVTVTVVAPPAKPTPKPTPKPAPPKPEHPRTKPHAAPRTSHSTVAPTARELPNTGAPAGPGTFALGGALVALGSALIRRSRRRTSRA